jgi:hypothetical protein
MLARLHQALKPTNGMLIPSKILTHRLGVFLEVKLSDRIVKQFAAKWNVNHMSGLISDSDGKIIGSYGVKHVRFPSA